MVLGSRAPLHLKPLTRSGLTTGLSSTPEAELEMWNENSDLLLGLPFGLYEDRLTENKEASNSGYFQIPLGFHLPSLILLDVTFRILRYELYPHRYHL